MAESANKNTDLLYTKEEEPSDESTCLDLSIKQVWLIVHYEDCDPGNEFEIVNDKQLVGDSWETLKRGVRVVIAYGNARVQATVLTVSGNGKIMFPAGIANWIYAPRK